MISVSSMYVLTLQGVLFSEALIIQKILATLLYIIGMTLAVQIAC